MPERELVVKFPAFIGQQVTAGVNAVVSVRSEKDDSASFQRLCVLVISPWMSPLSRQSVVRFGVTLMIVGKLHRGATTAHRADRQVTCERQHLQPLALLG